MHVTEQQAADDWSVADILITVTPLLPDAYKPRFLAHARKMVDSGARMAALLSLASVFPESEAAPLCDEAFALAGGIENPWVRVRSLSEVYEVLPSAHRERFLEVALAAVGEITNEWHKRRAMVPLARHLSEGQAIRAAEMARGITDPPTRIEVLSRYARVLPESERVDVFQHLPTLTDEAARVNTLLVLLPHVPETVQKLALTWLQEVTLPAPRIQALTGLGKYFPAYREVFVREAFGLAQGMEAMEGLYALLGLLGYLPEGEKAATWASLWDMVQAIEDPAFKASPMISLVRLGSEAERPARQQEVLATVRQIEGSRRLIMLAVLLGDLPEEARPAILDEILAGI